MWVNYLLHVPFYNNLLFPVRCCSETKEKQWRRPANDRRSARLAGSPVKASEETVMEQIKQNNRASRRLKGKVAPAYLVEVQDCV